MTGIRSLARGWAALLLSGAALPASLVSQQDIALVGVVRPPTMGPPEGWTVSVAGRFPDASTGPTRTSYGDVYVYRVPEATDSVMLIFFGQGLNAQAVGVPLAGHSYAHRVRDVVLSPSIVHRSAPGGTVPRSALRAELDEQAALAQQAGPAAEEVFRWNLQLYERALRDQPLLRRELEDFKRSPGAAPMISPTHDREISLYQRLIAREQGEEVQVAPAELLRFAGDASHAGSLRAAAIRALAHGEAPGEARPRVLEFLRRLEVSGDVAVIAPTMLALARIGEPADQQRILRATRAADPLVATAAIASAVKERLAGATRALAEAGRTHGDPQVRAAAVSGLADLDRNEAVRVSTEVLTGDADPQTKRVVLQTLRDSEVRVEENPALRRALENLSRSADPALRADARVLLPTP